MIDRVDPGLEAFKSTSAKLKQHFSSLIELAWKELGQDYFDGLASTMNHRVEAAVKVQG